MERLTFIIVIAISLQLIFPAVIFAQDKNDLADFGLLTDLLKKITVLTNQITNLQNIIKNTESELIKARSSLSPKPTTDSSVSPATAAVVPIVVSATLAVKLSSASPIADLPVIAGMGSFPAAVFDITNSDKGNVVYITTIVFHCIECQTEPKPITALRIYNGKELIGSLRNNAGPVFVWKLPAGELTIKGSGTITLTIVADFDVKGGDPSAARKIVLALNDLKAFTLAGKPVTVGALPLSANAIGLLAPGGVVGTTGDQSIIGNSYCAVKSDAVKVDLANNTGIGLTKKPVIGGSKSIDRLKGECFYNDIAANAYCAQSANLKIPYRRLAVFVDSKGTITADCLQTGCDLIRCPAAGIYNLLANIFLQLWKP